MTYKIFEGNLERLEKKLNRISDKCNKYGCEFHYEQVGEVFEEHKDEDGNPQMLRFVLIEASGKAILNDWQFAATLEHTEKGNIISGFGGVEIPERYYTAKPVCEHCKSNRYRKETYIVRNTVTGEFKQVGKSCLKDFTNGLSAEAVAQYISYFDTLIEGEAPYPGSSFIHYINRDEYLKFAAETIRCFGYVKNDPYSNERSTAVRAIDYLDAVQGRIRDRKTLNRYMKEMEDVGFDPESTSWLPLPKT